MRVSQLDVAQRVIRLEPGTTKNRDGREVLMTDSVHKLLSALAHGKAADDYVFTRANGKHGNKTKKPDSLPHPLDDGVNSIS